MSKERVDILEVLIKNKIAIPFTESEKKCFDNIDDDTRNTIYELIDSGAYNEEFIKTLKSIIEKSKGLSKEEYEYIVNKCEKEIEHLLYHNSDIQHNKPKQVK